MDSSRSPGPVSVFVKLQDNRFERCDIDHVRKRTDCEVVPKSKHATSEPEMEDEMPVVYRLGPYLSLL